MTENTCETCKHSRNRGNHLSCVFYGISVRREKHDCKDHSGRKEAEHDENE